MQGQSIVTRYRSGLAGKSRTEQSRVEEIARSVAGGKGLSREEFWREVGGQETYTQEKAPSLQVADKKTAYKRRK